MRSKCSIAKILLALLILILGVSMANGQTKQILTWQERLASAEKLPAGELEEQQDEIARIRTGVEFWIRLHPNTTITLQSAPQQPLNSDQITKEVAALREAVGAILKEDRGQSFQLGTTVVSVTAEASPLSPITDSFDHNGIQSLQATNIAQAVQYLPGVALDVKSGRNQTGIMIRGFDTRQVGIFLDNIPILVPYDGYADINRFLASDISVIEVAKGYASPLLGPNGLGGAVNVVTRQPERKFEGDLKIGTGSGDMLDSGVHIGSHWDKFFFRGGMDWLQTDYFPLSGDFATNSLQTNWNRMNADQRDVRYSGRFGWTPRENDQYIFSYTKQKADYGAPPYVGNEPQYNRARYWRWNKWNRDSYYLSTNTGLGKSSSIKFRAFLDFYPNQLNMYDNANFNSTTTNGTGWSNYDDHSEGFASEFTTKLIPRHTLSASFFLKGDTHQERGLSVSKKGSVVTETLQPWRKHRDYLTSIGILDSIRITSRMNATVGMNADHLGATRAENVSSGNIIVPFQCSDGTANDSFSACLAHEWAFNPLASVSYSVADSGSLFFTFALKSHFPNMKDRYSYKNGQALPNPSIKSEHSRNYTLGYSHAFGSNTMMQVELFRSDMYDAIQRYSFLVDSPTLCPSNTIGEYYYCQQAINVGKELHQGVELSVRTSPVRRLSLNANYTYLNRKISDLNDDSIETVFPAGTPKHRAVGIANIRFPREIQLLVTARYEAGVFNTIVTGAGVTEKRPASKYATMDAGGVFPIYRGTKLQVGVKNLFDRNYYYQEGFPEPGRNWYINMRYEF